MKKIKMLVVSTSGFEKKEGISTVIFDYLIRFDKERFDLNLVVDGSYDEYLVDSFAQNGIKIHFLHSRKKKVCLYVKELYREIKNEKYDVVYVHGSSAIMSIELLLAKLTGCKVRIAHSHNTTCDHRYVDKMLRPLFYKLYTDAFACGTEAGKWLFGNRSFKVIRNGRDINRYSYNHEKRVLVRTELGVNNDCLLVGHVGNFNNQKNHQFVLRVFKELLEIKSNAKLYLIGKGDMLYEIEQQASNLGLLENVVFTGSISNVEDMLQAMDVMILPSLHEGLPLVVAEWQIAALPSLISDKVTKEVAFTNLVHFMPLEVDCSSWAEKIFEISQMDRSMTAKDTVKKAKENGFDIDEDAKNLQKYFIDKCIL